MTELQKERIEDLISRMSVDEKLDLLDHDTSNLPFDEMPEDMRSVLNGRERRTPEYFYQLYRYYTTMTPSGVPHLATSEALHGLCNASATIFPQAITMAATFNRENAYNMGYVIGAEAAATGINEVWSPCAIWPASPATGAARRPTARTTIWRRALPSRS